MASQLAWLNHDSAQLRRTLAAIELFKDEGTIDELGLGSIRDTLADLLFPGTSVLHTRARYLLFVPWLLERTASRGLPPDRAVAALRQSEIALIHALVAGGEIDGVIGRQARERLRRMPSAAYWAATRRFGIRTWSNSVEGHFRRARDVLAMRRLQPDPDDPQAPGAAGRLGADPSLPDAPAGLLTNVTFGLTYAEADYLQERFVTSAAGSMLAWLVTYADDVDATWIWTHPAAAGFPPQLARAVDHGRRLHTAMFGAVLLYNLLVARRAGLDDRVDAYRQWLTDWAGELEATAVLENWDVGDLWHLLLSRNPRITSLTRMFVEQWLGALRERGTEVADDTEVHQLIMQRERQLKGGRGLLVNQGARDTWSGASGVVRLDFRWAVARRLLADVFAGLGRCVDAES